MLKNIQLRNLKVKLQNTINYSKGFVMSIDVYGIGNAMVDYEVEVSEEDIAKLNIEKGKMTLVDEARQNELISHIQGVSHKRTCGGSAANSMIGVSQLGGGAFYSCKIAADETGSFYYDELSKEGLASNFDEQERLAGVTGKCLVLITPDADRTLETYLGITETFSVNELVPEKLKTAKYLYIEGYLVTSPTGRAAAIEARKIAQENAVKTSLTFSDPNMVEFFKDGLLEIIGDKIDIIFCNEEEAKTFAKTDDLEKAIAEIRQYCHMVVVTVGAKGALVVQEEERIEIPGYKVHSVDTTGAGDMFAGAFLYGITNGLSLESSGKLASFSASQVVSKFGARLDKSHLETVYHFLKDL